VNDFLCDGYNFYCVNDHVYYFLRDDYNFYCVNDHVYDFLRDDYDFYCVNDHVYDFLRDDYDFYCLNDHVYDFLRDGYNFYCVSENLKLGSFKVLSFACRCFMLMNKYPLTFLSKSDNRFLPLYSKQLKYFSLNHAYLF